MFKIQRLPSYLAWDSVASCIARYKRCARATSSTKSSFTGAHAQNLQLDNPTTYNTNLMIGCPSHRRAIARGLLSSLICPSRQIYRSLATKSRARSQPSDMLAAETELAQQLLATGLWRDKRSRTTKNSVADTRRVNIVSEELCCTRDKSSPGCAPHHRRSSSSLQTWT